MTSLCRVALVTTPLSAGGGVPTVANWLTHGLRLRGMLVDVHEVAVSAKDPDSRRVLRPPSLTRRTLEGRSESGVTKWGANFPEVEVMRYRPRAELTRVLDSYDIVQVVSGGAALAGIARRVQSPVAMQVATRVTWERERLLEGHSWDVAWKRRMSDFVSRLEDEALRHASAVFVENRVMHDYVESLGQSNVIMAPPGVDIDTFRPRGVWDAGAPLLSVARLSDPRKGLLRLVGAYRLLRDSFPEAPRLVLAGRGPLDPALASCIDRLGLTESVEVRVNEPQEDLADLYAGSSVYVQTSYEEGLGLSTLEAMASGIPVVATNTAGAQEVVRSGETGWLIDQGDDRDVMINTARAIEQVLAGEGHAMAENARRVAVECHSGSQSLDAFEAEYRRLVGQQ